MGECEQPPACVQRTLGPSEVSHLQLEPHPGAKLQQVGMPISGGLTEALQRALPHLKRLLAAGTHDSVAKFWLSLPDDR